MQIKENTAKKTGYRQVKRQISSLNGLVIILFSIFCTLSSQAQCAMCRASLESEGNTLKAEAVNDGIVYLMAIPYIIVAVVAFAVYRLFKKKNVPQN